MRDEVAKVAKVSTINVHKVQAVQRAVDEKRASPAVLEAGRRGRVKGQIPHC